MSLVPGSRVGVYEVVAQLGAGGMGEVYRARDSRLQRDVALKVLIAAVAGDADRLARFSREAQVLAALNHPNIASIYGLEDGAIVMELVEGPTLADRLREGALPWDEALSAAKQICEALGAAHESGIIHRDLKPANIKFRTDGTVKVLDFGLAKALEPAGAGANVSQSPTLSVHATQQGLILGTAAYMAPEQARGRPVDRRADIWAFGVVLFEMLTGRRAFAGDDVSITLAAVLKDNVDWTALPADLPPPVRRLLRRCLEKDPRRRLNSIGDARLELEDAAAPPDDLPSAPVVTVAVPAPRMPWAVATLATLVAIGTIGVWRPWRAPAEPPRVVFEIPAPTNANGWGNPVVLSPDGRHLLTRAGEPGAVKLWVRALDRQAGVALAGTEGAGSPFWAADGRHVGFFDADKLKRVDLLGSSPQTLADGIDGRGGAWSAENVIVYAPTQNGPLFRIAATGGTPVQVTELNQSRGELTHRFPIFLPDGNHFVYLAICSRADRTGIYLGSLDRREATLVVASSHRPEFAPPDVLVFFRGGSLMAQRLDVSRAQLTGEPIQVAEQINSNPAQGTASVSVAATALAYLPGVSGGRRLLWKNADDKPGEPIGGLALFDNPRLSPDGTRLAVATAEGDHDLWIYDLERGTNTRFTFDKATDNVPVWSPDGSRIAFVSNRDGGVFNIYQRNAGGTGEDELLLKTPANKVLNDWSADGRYLLYTEIDPKSANDLWALPLLGDRKPIRVLATPFNERQGAFSPDGRYIAYSSDEGGSSQVFVQTFPASGGKWQVSMARGSAPRWRPDGKQLFYDRTGQMMAVDVLALGNGQFKAGVPRPLFQGLQSLGPHNYDVAADGRRFVIVAGPNAGPDGPSPITVVLNWKSALP